MYWEDFLNMPSTIVENKVSHEKVEQFKQALGFLDKAADHVPPTFVRSFSFGEINGLTWPDAGMIHAEQEYEYHRPIAAGETLQCSQQIEQIVRKNGRSGEMAFIYLTQTGRDDRGNIVFVSKRVLVWKTAGSGPEGVPQ